MHSARAVSLVVVAVFVAATVAATDADAAAASSRPKQALSNAIKKPIHSWTVEDTEYWMTHIIGYPEYAPAVTTHRIDGPTLLYLDPETAFNTTHPVHQAKLEAHIDLLRGRCLCPASQGGAGDLWSLVDDRPVHATTVGAAALFTPRAALLYTYLLDNETFAALMLNMGPEGSEEDDNDAPRGASFLLQLVYLTLTLLAPNVLVLYKLITHAFWSNYFLVPLCAIHLCVDQYNDAIFLWVLLKAIIARKPKDGEDDKANKTPKELLIGHFKTVWTVAPIAVFPLSYILPSMFGKLLLVVFCGHSLMLCVGLAGLAFGALNSNKKDGGKGGEGQQPQPDPKPHTE